MLARPTSLRRKKQSGEECGDSWERLQAADLTGDQPAAQNTMGAEVSGSLRRTPSRPPRSALGLDGVGAPRQAPAARPRGSSQGWGASVHARNLRDCRPDQVASSDQILHFRKLKTSSVPSRAEVRGSRGPLRGPRSRKLNMPMHMPARTNRSFTGLSGREGRGRGYKPRKTTRIS